MALIDIIRVNNKLNDIVLIGEILLDKITNEQSEITNEVLGGSSTNVAMNIKKLGHQPLLFATVGNDEIGIKLLTELKKNKIDISNINVIKKETSVVEVNNSSATPLPKFVRGADYNIVFSDKLEHELSNTKIFHFSYWPLSEEPSKSTVLKAIEFANTHDIIIGFDPNYHIGLNSKKSISINELKEVMKKVDIIKPSLDDSKRLFGEGFSNLDYLKMYQKLGIKLIVLTIGKDGLIVSFEGEVFELPSFAKDIVDVTGAGDAFWSGLYSGILNGESIGVSLKLGLACSAYNLKEVGSVQCYPAIEEIKKEYNIR